MTFWCNFCIIRCYVIIREKNYHSIFCLCGVNLLAFTQTNNIRTIVLEIHNVTINSGTLHISVSLNEASYRSRCPDLTFEFAPISKVVRQEINLPMGKCVINIYQDINNNGQADTSLFGIPKEPVGVSNWNESGPPGNFRRHKIIIDETTTTIVINLYQL